MIACEFPDSAPGTLPAGADKTGGGEPDADRRSMIGRTAPVDHYAVIAWARRQALEHDLRPIEAHVLLLLATRANRDGVAWPSLGTLADEAGVARQGHRSSTISRALDRLADHGLIWTREAGNGRPARRELLYNPASDNVVALRANRSRQREPPFAPAQPEEPVRAIEEPGTAFAQARTLPPPSTRRH